MDPADLPVGPTLAVSPIVGPNAPIAPDAPSGIPKKDDMDAFVLRDLDTGFQTYINEPLDWVEKPVDPREVLNKPSRLEHAPAAAPSLLPEYAPAALDAKPPPIPTRLPPLPVKGLPAPRRAGGLSKRAMSDELRTASSHACRSADHVRVAVHKKREREFSNLYRWQRVRAHAGIIRVIRFSRTGRYLATAGEDTVIKVWDVDVRLDDLLSPPAVPSAGPNRADGSDDVTSSHRHPRHDSHIFPSVRHHAHHQHVYLRKGTPLVVLKGHTSDVLDLSWSKNDFILSASVDKTIRLWHPKARQCLRRFMHSDFVTSVAFHPSDEQICISGASDGTVRLWHIKEQKLLSLAEVDDLITACAISPDGTTALVGTHQGRCMLYGLFDEIQGEWQFKHTTQLDVRSRRAKNARGKKIAGFSFRANSEDVLVSSNDSRLRLFRMDDKAVVSKYVGHQNSVSHLSGSFSPCGRYVLCGSENREVCIWEVENSMGMMPKRKPVNPNSEDAVAPRKDKNVSYESFLPHDHAHVTAAAFSPRRVPRDTARLTATVTNRRTSGLVIVTASDDGELRVFGCS